MDVPDRLTVVTSYEQELRADRADLYVTVKGSSLVGGTQALKRAKEVGQLVLALSEQGVAPDDASQRQVVTAAW